MLFANVILPIPLQGLYTYSIPPELIPVLQLGSRVIVQFGKKKFYTAIVFEIYKSNEKKEIKEIISTLEDFPIIPAPQLKFWEWLSIYYMCSLGDVYRSALPAVLKLESETHVILNPDFIAESPLIGNELKVYHYLLSNKNSTISSIQKETGISNVLPVVKSLADKQIIFITENIHNTYSPKTISAVRLTKDYSEEELNLILNHLQKAKKQHQLLLAFLGKRTDKKIIFKKELLEGTDISSSVLSELVKKGILEIYEFEVNRFDYGESDINRAKELNSHQQNAYKEIIDSFGQRDITLLHGVTSSGKTEIYIQLIKYIIEQGKQVLYLLPEIALTTQITNRLKAVFGNKLAVYHSKFNDNERAEIWTRLLKDNDIKVVLGARSAIFLPFDKLGLIIVDEEHEGSYKQQDPAPRYNARNAAIVLANIYNAKVLLGTATPSIETYHNAITGKYGFVQLSERFENIQLPEINIVNTKELRRKKQMKSILSPFLIDNIKEALARKEQIILFQNRRGFSSLIECKNCSWTPHCLHCDVSLTYHKHQQVMICHYCGAVYRVPTECPECKTPTLDTLGYGTERIEEEVKQLFPEAAIARMDLDTTRGKKSYENIISQFEENKTNILIGTQMVSKGLDFDNVSIVGILNADNLLNYPDFRAYEKAFQLMTQVSGRAGRKNKQGSVILQTGHPGHPLISYIRNNDYKSFFDSQMEERKIFHYPPFFRLIKIVLRGRDERITEKAAIRFSQSLKETFDYRVLGPSRPPISRIQSLYIQTILIKIENQASIQKVRESIYHYQNISLNDPEFKSILLHYDVDPF